MTAPVLHPQILRDWLATTRPDAPTPAYVYDAEILRGRIAWLKSLLGDMLDISFAIKSNPNSAILRIMNAAVPFLDASSWGEVQRALDAGKKPDRISYSGPGKRHRELRAAVAKRVPVVVESMDEIEQLVEICHEERCAHDVLIRINPDHVPRGFGASMSGRSSQFGLDETAVPAAIDRIDRSRFLQLVGMHIYTGSNALLADPIVENFSNMSRLFLEHTNKGSRSLSKLIFGSGFGIPYHAGQSELDVEEVVERITPILRRLREAPGFAQSRFILEMGRWIAGPMGALVTHVLSRKTSRGQEIAVCDAGFNAHLAACGMMGATFRKDYPIVALDGARDAERQTIKLTGPLCTSIDSLAGPMELPLLKRGDAVAIMQSGAYGLTASPTRFISHPDPVEILADGGHYLDITEHRLNHVLDSNPA